MGIVNMVRHVRRLGGAPSPINLTTSETTTDKIPFGDSAYGSFILTGSITTITFWTLKQDGSTRVPIYDDNGAAVSRSGLAAGRSYPFPDQVSGVDVLLMVADATGTVELIAKG